MSHKQMPLLELLKSRPGSPLLEAASNGQKNPLKFHRHDPSLWWQRNHSNRPETPIVNKKHES